MWRAERAALVLQGIAGIIQASTCCPSWNLTVRQTRRRRRRKSGRSRGSISLAKRQGVQERKFQGHRGGPSRSRLPSRSVESPSVPSDPTQRVFLTRQLFMHPPNLHQASSCREDDWSRPWGMRDQADRRDGECTQGGELPFPLHPSPQCALLTPDKARSNASCSPRPVCQRRHSPTPPQALKPGPIAGAPGGPPARAGSASSSHTAPTPPLALNYSPGGKSVQSTPERTGSPSSPPPHALPLALTRPSLRRASH